MEVFYESPDGRAKLYLGDAIETMAQFPDACVDAIVTDPPYGLEFMGKEWDSPLKNLAGLDLESDKPHQRHNVKHWSIRNQKCLRCGHWRWSGTPCECDSPLFTKREIGMEVYQQWTTAWAAEAYRVLKPGAYMLVMGGTRTHHRLGCGLEDAGFEIRDCLAWIYATGFPKNYDVSKGIDKRAGAEREVGGKYQLPSGQEWNLKQANDPNVEAAPGTFTASGRRTLDKTQPATPEAQYWEGYGTALKPAHEPIWLCKKPNEGTYVDNVLEHGCGAMNIDGSRIGYEQRTYKGAGASPQKIQGHGPGDTGIGMLDGKGKDMEFNVSGRWPANVLVDCYPEEFQGGVVIERSNWEKERGQDGLIGPYYTRYFVIPKPSKAEKNKGCTELYYRKVKGRHTRINREEWEELVAEEERIKRETGKRKILQARGNIHVTVKPVRLGMWLIKLITPHQHPVVVADLFCGSGSFLVSGLRLNQEQGYQIQMWGIDKDKDSVETARARVDMAKKRLAQARLL